MRTDHTLSRLAWMATATGICLLAAVNLPAMGPTLDGQRQQPPSILLESVDGSDSFQRYCATCHGRSGKGRMPVVGAVEVEGRKPKRLRLAALADYSARSLHAFIAQAVAPDATIKTDAWQGYPGAPVAGHDPRTVGAMAAHLVLPWTHRVFSNLKRWALGTYHGLRRHHLQAYLDEFVFRFNRRHDRHAAFHRLLGLATLLPHASYQMLIARS